MLTFFNRWRGMNTADSPIHVGQTLRKALCAVPFGILGAFIAWFSGLSLLYIVDLGIFSLLMTFGAFTDGHGNQMDLGKSDEAQEKPNLWDKIFGKEGFTSEFLGLTASGFLVVVSTLVILVGTGHFLAAGLFAVGPGLLKGASYWLAQVTKFKNEKLWCNGPDERGVNTDAGELFWGFAMDVGIILLVVLLLVGMV